MKGGVGKTTTSVNLATGLAMRGEKTLLVDLDPQSNTTSMYLDEIPDNATSGLLKGEVAAQDTVQLVDDNLWLIPSTLELANTEMELRMQSHIPHHNKLQKALLQIKDQYAYCIVDCPPIINLLTVNAIMASNLIIVPIKPDRFALQGFMVTMQNIEQIRESWDLALDYKVLFSIVNRNNEEREIITQLKSLIPSKTYDTEIRSQPKPIAGASARRRAVIKEEDTKIGVANDFRKLIVEIAGCG